MERYFEKIGDHLIVKKRENRKGDFIVFVFYDFIPVTKFNNDKLAERRLAAVDLVELGVCNQTVAAHICGFHRNSVARFLELKNTLGIEALFDENRGLKKPIKYGADVRGTIERLLSEYPECSDRQIAKQASEALKMDVHRNAVARIRISNQPEAENEPIILKERLVDLNRIAEEIDQEKNDAHQLELNFEADELFRQKKEELEQLEPLQSSNKTEQNLIERLQKGERNPLAGTLMHHFFLEDIDYKQLFKGLPPSDGTTYENIDILSTLFFSIAGGVKSIEALKLVNPRDLGCLLGAERAPDKDVIRKRLQKLAEANLCGKLIDAFARVLLDKQRIDDEVFFIDGHFLPYYGLHVIAKGYYTVRRLAMKGNELYVVSDLKGRPLFSFTESNEIDFRPIISLAADKLIELGIRRPVLTFDRGGYGICFFSELDRKADFVTWAKYINDNQLKQFSDDCFTGSLAVNQKKYRVAEQYRDVSESAQTAKKEGRATPVKMQLRLVVIENMATAKRVGIFTNNRSKSAETIAYYMLNRWGDSENLYKELMAQFNLDYHPGYDINELQEQPLIDNPDIALTKKAIRFLKAEVDALLESQRQIQIRLSQRKDKRLTKKLANVIKELEDKEFQKLDFEKKLKSLPDKVSIIELLDGKPMSRCDLEKKKLYDLMQFVLLHSFERLQELFEPYYSDFRDIKPVLRMICRQSGVLKLIGDTLIVLLDRIDRKKYRDAAVQFCHQLNRSNITLNGRIKVKLYFYVSKF